MFWLYVLIQFAQSDKMFITKGTSKVWYQSLRLYGVDPRRPSWLWRDFEVSWFLQKSPRFEVPKRFWKVAGQLKCSAAKVAWGGQNFINNTTLFRAFTYFFSLKIRLISVVCKLFSYWNQTINKLQQNIRGLYHFYELKSKKNLKSWQIDLKRSKRS